MSRFSIPQLILFIVVLGLLLTYNRGVVNITGAIGPQIVGLIRALLNQNPTTGQPGGYA